MPLLSTFTYAYLNRDDGTDTYSAIVVNYITLDFAMLNEDGVGDYTAKNMKIFAHVVSYADAKDGGEF